MMIFIRRLFMPENEEAYKAFQFRCPLPLYEKLLDRARDSRRSLNSEIIVCLEDFFALAGKDIEDLTDKEAVMRQIRLAKIRWETDLITVNTLIEKYEAVKENKNK
jgi:hypothetical protein